MAVGVCPECRLAHAESFPYIISSHPFRDTVEVNGCTEELINMPFAVIVLASDTAHRYLVALGGCIEPRLLDLINGHHFFTRIIVKHLILLFPFYWLWFLCWLFCFCLLLGLLLLAGITRL